MSNEVRVSTNKIFITGELIAYNNVKQAVNKKGSEYISGEAIIRTVINEQELDHKVKFYSNKLTSKGAESKAYVGFVTSVNQDKTREKDGQGDIVQVVGSLRENSYAKDGEIRVFNEIAINFAPKRVNADSKHIASIEIEGIIRTIDKEMVDERPTDRLTVSLLAVNYGGELVEVKGVVPAEIAQSFKGMYRPEKTGTLYFDIVPVLVKGEKKTELGFGQATVQSTEYVKVERVLTGGSVPCERDRAYKPEEIVQLINLRKAKQEEKLANAEKEKQNNLGFGSVGATTTTPTTMMDMMGADNPFSSDAPF